MLVGAGSDLTFHSACLLFVQLLADLLAGVSGFFSIRAHATDEMLPEPFHAV